jgi:rubrerythrin
MTVKRQEWGCSVSPSDESHIQNIYLNNRVYSARLTMLSTIPIDLTEIDKENIDREILRVGIIAELDAINLYEQMASLAKSEAIKASLLDVAKEEKTHVGEFQALLLKVDHEQADELEHGRREVEEMGSK